LRKGGIFKNVQGFCYDITTKRVFLPNLREHYIPQPPSPAPHIASQTSFPFNIPVVPTGPLSIRKAHSQLPWFFTPWESYLPFFQEEQADSMRSRTLRPEAFKEIHPGMSIDRQRKGIEQGKIAKIMPAPVWEVLARLVWHMLVRHHYALDITFVLRFLLTY
jgi:hypothetical protein